MSAKKKTPQPSCGRRNKSCRKCKYRYKAGDKTWECPKCGTDRHCRTPVRVGYSTCRMHGSGGNRPPKLKLTIPDKLDKTVNRILDHPDLLELSFEIGMNLSQMQEIATSLSDADTAGVGIEVDKGITIAQTGLIKQSMGGVQRGLDIIREARSVERKNENLRRELREHLKLSHLLVTGEHKMRLDAEINVTGVEVLEILSFFQSLMFVLLKDRPTDQAWFMRKWRAKYKIPGDDE